MCSHHKVYICPTEDTSWGVADTYQLKCISCHGILLDRASRDEILKYLQQNKHEIISGTGYII